jgi:hypothetical protein
LQGNKQFLIRCYATYYGNGVCKTLSPLDPVQYVTTNRKLDLVLCYHSENGDINDWNLFVKKQIACYGKNLAKIQITEEPNLHGLSTVDGDYINVRQALVSGVVAAKEEAKRLGLSLDVGFNGIVNFDLTYDFWREINSIASPEFYLALDYVGLDFFPDVFRSIPQEGVPEAVLAVLQHFRNSNLSEAGIAITTPIHITENGWPTSPERSENKQADVLEIVVRTIFTNRERFNITTYELFDLRDADSKNPNIFYQFGIMRDDYSPKMAFYKYQKLIEDFGR